MVYLKTRKRASITPLTGCSRAWASFVKFANLFALAGWVALVTGIVTNRPWLRDRLALREFSADVVYPPAPRRRQRRQFRDGWRAAFTMRVSVAMLQPHRSLIRMPRSCWAGAMPLFGRRACFR